MSAIAVLDTHAETHRKALQEELRELMGVVGPVPLVDLLFERAFQLRATDIHLDPHETGVRVRIRVDGMLHDVLQIPSSQAPHMISRIKLMAGLNIAERRLPQDGHIPGAIPDQHRDIRVGSGPTTFGERLVLRLMPDRAALNRFDELGFEPDQVRQLEELLASPHGMLLSAGPVGSGKSTLMYTCIDSLNDISRSIVSIEDPVERRVVGVSQIQVEPKIGFGFVEALRAVLRQDPNVIMVGEIRDSETAQIAVRAGRTGVQVLSTIHAQDAAAALDMLRDFQVPAMFIADSVEGIISQRLLRKVCPNCVESYRPDPATWVTLGVDFQTVGDRELRRGKGCDACFQTGYLGRTGVFEIFQMDHELRTAVLACTPRQALMEKARRKGMRLLPQVAAQKVLDGVTTVEEMHRVLLAYPTSGDR